jgi:hypothetical protein|tara:strand:- start:149 stop:292 length:144 start_codon:yes stop_codon:yes gene_type:complete
MKSKVEMAFEIVEIILTLIAGGLILYVLIGFSQAMDAWNELHNLMNR